MSTKIEWVQNPDGTRGRTWNPSTGCSKISSGCKHCYAERMAYRLAGRYGYPADEPFKVTLHPERLKQPHSWKKSLMIFVCSMSDLFHEDIPDDFIFRVVETMENCPHHTFQLLTKRSRRLFEVSDKITAWPNNIWVGVTVEAKEYKYRMDDLRKVNALVRFVSCEPLLEDLGKLNLDGIDWVIVGGESGPRARPIRLEWVAKIRDQCLDKQVAYFFKQWGGVNKSAAGRKLEGREWNQMPRSSQSQYCGQMKLIQ
jgi:protein gp37